MDRTELPHDERSADGSRTELSTTEARQATTTGRVRYMLGIGIGLVVIAFLIIYFLFVRSWYSPYG